MHNSFAYLTSGKKSYAGVYNHIHRISLFLFLCFLSLSHKSVGQAAMTAYSTGFSGTLENYAAASGFTTVTRSSGNADEGIYNNQAIGFDFYYMGVRYTHVAVSTNGWIKLGTSGVSISNATPTNNISSGGERPLLAPLWDNLWMGSLQTKVSGTAPNRVYELRFPLMYWDFNSFNNFEMRVHIEESGRIIYFYQASLPVMGSGATRSAHVGLTASGTGNGNFVALNTLNSNTPIVITSGTPTQLGNTARNQATTARKFTFAPALVAAPTDLSLVSNGDGSVTVAFTDNATTEVNYQIYYSTDPNVPFNTPAANDNVSGRVQVASASGSGSTVSQLITGLEIGTTYYFRVVAVKERQSNSLTGSIEVTGSSNEVTISSIVPTSICPGDAFNIDFTATGVFEAENIYQVQLSNASGNFGSPTVIGSLTSTSASGTIPVTIPSGLATGTGYRIRIRASAPITVGSDNGSNITLNQGLNIAAVSPLTYSRCQNISVDYSLGGCAFATGNSFILQLSDATGSFASPTVLATLANTNSAGTIAGAIPIGTPTGTGYRVRVVSTDPVQVSNINGSNITINTNLSITAFGPVTYSPDDNISVSINNTGCTYEADNSFILQLSDAAGSFASPTVLATLTNTTTASSINGNIPGSVPSGIGYRVRVVTTNPAHITNDNGSNLTIRRIITWAGTTTSFGTASNWNPAIVPSGPDEVLIDGTASVQPVVSGTESIGVLTLSGGSLSVSNGATLQITQGNFTVSGGTLSLGETSTVSFTSATAQEIPSANYGNLTSSGAGSRNAASKNIQIRGTFTPGTPVNWVTTNSNFSFIGANQTIPAMVYHNLSTGGTGTKTLASSGNIDINGEFSPSDAVSYTITGSTVRYVSSSAQTIKSFNYNNLVGNLGSGNRTLDSTADIGVAGVFTPVTGATVFILKSTIHFNATGTSTQIIPGWNAYYNLKCSGSSTTGSKKRLGGDIIVNNDFILTGTGGGVQFRQNIRGTEWDLNIFRNFEMGSLTRFYHFDFSEGTGNLNNSTGGANAAQTIIFGDYTNAGGITDWCYHTAATTTYDNTGAPLPPVYFLGNLVSTGGMFTSSTYYPQYFGILPGGNNTANLILENSETPGDKIVNVNYGSQERLNYIFIASGYKLGSNISVTHNSTIGSAAADFLSFTRVQNNSTLDFGTFTLGGNTQFVGQTGGTIRTAHEQGISTTAGTGSIRNTGTKTFQDGLNYVFNGTTAQVTGNAVSTTNINNITISNPAGVTLTNASLTVYGTLAADTGTFDLSGKTLTVRNGNAPFTRSIGKINTTSSTNINFGITGGVGGAKIVIPNGLFTGTQGIFNNVTLNRTNGLDLGDQQLVVHNALTLTAGELNAGAAGVKLMPTSSIPTETATAFVSGLFELEPRPVGTGALNFAGLSISIGDDDLGNVSVSRRMGSLAVNDWNSSNPAIGARWSIESQFQPVSGRDVTFSWRSAFDNSRPLTNMWVYRMLNSVDGFVRIGSSATNVSSSDPRTVTVTTTHFSEWTVNNDDVVLPVTLLGLSAKVNEKKNVELRWATATEVNASHFEIQRRLNTSDDFETIATVKASGNSNSILRYLSIDEQLKSLANGADYRLKMVDLDGKYEYSNTLVVKLDATVSKNRIAGIYPNPVKDRFTLSLELNQSEDVEMEIYNMQGLRVHKTTLKGEAGINAFNQNIPVQLAKGVYTIQLHTLEGMLQEKIVVE